MNGARRLSQAISEGDGISVLAEVVDGPAARAAEEQGAEGIVLRGPATGVRDATQLPVLSCGLDFAEARAAGFDAVLVRMSEIDPEQLPELVGHAHELGLECVVEVTHGEEIEWTLETLDPEIFMLSAADADDDQPAFDRVLELLEDVPAGKLAIAELHHADERDVAELERRGFDAVAVVTPDVEPLVGEALPEV